MTIHEATRILIQTAAIAAGLVLLSAAWDWIEGRWQR
jgi:TRAP-type C4-dicarboxylate transport system permease small subunit